MKMTLIRQRLAAFTVGVALSSSSLLEAATVTYLVDTNLSSVTLSGSVSVGSSTFDLKEQSPGSLTDSYGGTLIANVDGGKIQFLGGNQLAALENHSYKPGLGGVDGTAPASYGATASGTIIIFAVAADAASRRISFDVTSPPLAMTGDTFPAGSINYQFLETQNGVVDFSISGAAKAKGSKVLGGLLTNGISVAATLTGGVLNIPVDVFFRFVTQASGQDVVFKLFFKGTIVAKEGTTPEEPLVKFEPFVSGQPLKLFWSPSYKLQRATTLSPLNWADFATASPVTIPTIQPGEYFRVVHK